MFALCSLPSDIVNFYRASVYMALQNATVYRHFRPHVLHIVVTGSRTICIGSNWKARHEGLIFRSISVYVSSHKNDQIWHGNTRGGATFWWGHKKGTLRGGARSVPKILGPQCMFSFVYRSLYVLLNMGTSLDGLIALLVCLQCSCE